MVAGTLLMRWVSTSSCRIDLKVDAFKATAEGLLASGYAAAARQMEWKSSSCTEWIVLQEVDLGSNDVSALLLCMRNDRWRTTKFSFVDGVATSGAWRTSSTVSVVDLANAFRGPARIDGERFTVLDGTMLFISASGSSGPHASYAVPEDEQEQKEVYEGFVMAQRLINEAFAGD
jgi:hypothetical protein